MSKLFINTIIQYGGELSDSDKVTILNVASKHINKKMKILEYTYGIQLKLNKLQENNSDCVPRRIGIQTFAQIEGPIQGQIPFYTTTELAVPSVSAVTTGVPLTPYGPIVGVPGLAINPFGSRSDLLKERIEKAIETLSKLKKISNKLEATKCEDIADDDSIKKCFKCLDLDEEKNDDELREELDKIIS